MLWPLSRGTAPQAGGSEATVYRDQLAEIDRDVAAGLIGVSEAEAARVEIGRRLLAAADAERDLPARSNLGLRRAAAVVALVALPIAAVTFYLSLGSPQLGDFPLASRTRTADANQPLDNLVAQVEAHLEKNPTDGRGWTVLAPVLARLGRYDDAVRAYRNVDHLCRRQRRTPRRSRRGDCRCCRRRRHGGGQGRVRTRGCAERRRGQGRLFPRARGGTGRPGRRRGFDLGRMLAKAPADAPWRPLVQAALARVGGPAPPALSNDAMAAAKDMSEADRGAMIRGMVDRLATRLKQNGDDVEGWLRLVRAYMVMGERDKAASALADARQAVANDAERLRQLNEGAQESRA